jgi:hypothetical protein
MGEETNRRSRYGRRRAEEFRAGFAVPAFPAGSKVGIKQIAFLHWYCRLDPHLIAARYSKVLSLADVHLALAHYFRNPEPIDAEIKRELAFNVRNGLARAGRLPRVGLEDLADLSEE